MTETYWESARISLGVLRPDISDGRFIRASWDLRFFGPQLLEEVLAPGSVLLEAICPAVRGN